MPMAHQLLDLEAEATGLTCLVLSPLESRQWSLYDTLVISTSDVVKLLIDGFSVEWCDEKDLTCTLRFIMHYHVL